MIRTSAEKSNYSNNNFIKNKYETTKRFDKTSSPHLLKKIPTIVFTV